MRRRPDSVRTPRAGGARLRNRISRSTPLAITTLLATMAMATISQAADLDGNGIVDGADQSVLLASWGTCPAPCPSDLNGDGVVDGIDLAVLLDAASSEGGGDTDTIDSEGLYEDGAPSDTPSGGTVLGPVVPDPAVKGDEVAIPIHNVPLPAPAWMGLAGLAGAALLRRRITSRVC